jgi:hypothetical protein
MTTHDDILIWMARIEGKLDAHIAEHVVIRRIMGALLTVIGLCVGAYSVLRK